LNSLGGVRTVDGKPSVTVLVALRPTGAKEI
jgi:hypothetical protein